MPTRCLRRGGLLLGPVAMVLLAACSEEPPTRVDAPPSPTSRCEPATTQAEAERAKDRFADDFLDTSGVNGVGVGGEGDGYVIVVFATPGTDAGLPECFRNVPVRSKLGGPFTAGPLE